MDFILYILALAAINVILTASINLISGQAGLLTVAHAAFMAFGAYATALLTVNGVPYPVSVLAGMAFAAVTSAALMRVSLQIRGFLYTIISFSFMLVTTSVLNNWIDVTQGPFGVKGIPAAKFFGEPLFGYAANLALDATVMVIAVALLWRLSSSPFGLALRALREDETAAASLGKDVERLKIVTFVVGSVLAAVAGSLYAPLISFIDPSVFTLFISLNVLTMLIVGGTGSLPGSILGAVVLTAAPQALSFVQLPTSVLGPLRQMFYGLALIAVLRFRPAGAVPERPWRRILKGPRPRPQTLTRDTA